MFSPVESNQGFNFKPELPTSSAYYRLLKKLRRQVGHAIRDFKMIEEGDKVMVCISGGKDSYTLLDIMLQFKRIAPINFDVVAVNLDQKQPGFPEDVLPRYLEENNIPYYILEKESSFRAPISKIFYSCFFEEARTVNQYVMKIDKMLSQNVK